MAKSVAPSSVTVAYYLQNKAALDATGPISIVDGASHVAAHFDELNADPEVTSIALSGVGGDVLTLTLAQTLNDTHALKALTKPFSIAATGSAGGIEALTANQIAELSASGVTQIKATDQDVDLTAAQKMALGAAKLAIVQPYSGGSEEVIRYQPSGMLASVSYRGIVGAAYTSYTITYGTDARPVSASYSNGMTRTWTYNADGSYEIANAGVTGQDYTSYSIDYGTNGKPASASYSNGMTATWTYNADGSYEIANVGVTAQVYTSYTMDYGSDGKAISAAYDNGMTATWTYNADGTHTIAYAGVTGQDYSSYTTAYGTNGAPESAVYSDGMTAKWTYNADGGSEIAYAGVVGAAFTAYTLTYVANGRPATAIYNNGMLGYWEFHADGTYDIIQARVARQPYTEYSVHYGTNGEPISATYDNGMTAIWSSPYFEMYYGVKGAPYSNFMIGYGGDGRPAWASYNDGLWANWTYAPDGGHAVAYQFLNSSAGYFSHENVINPSGQIVADAEDMNDGSGDLRLYENNVTISSSSSGLSVTEGPDTFGVADHANEAIDIRWATSETFQYGSGFGQSSISGLQIGGPGTDVVQFDLSMFSGLSADNTAAQNWALLLSNRAAAQFGDDVTIADRAGDVLTLKDVTTNMLSANASNVFRFL